jgi:acetyl esterase/lipase
MPSIRPRSLLTRYALPLVLLGCFSLDLPILAAAPPRIAPTKPDLTYAEVGGHPLLLDLYVPESTQKPPLVVFIHGGSWRAGTYKNCPMAWLTTKGYAVASIQYRFSPEAVFPAQIFDCKAAVRWLRVHASEYGYDATRIAVAGQSAGGHLAVLLGTSGGEKELEGEVGANPSESSRVQAIVDFYGPSDFILRANDQPSFTDAPTGRVYQLLGQGVKTDPERAKLASGAWHVTSDDPPLLAIHGTKDPQVLPNQSERLCQAYQALKLENTLHFVEGGVHGGPLFDTPEVHAIVADFLAKHLKAQTN